MCAQCVLCNHLQKGKWSLSTIVHEFSHTAHIDGLCCSAALRLDSSITHDGSARCCYLCDKEVAHITSSFSELHAPK